MGDAPVAAPPAVIGSHAAPGAGHIPKPLGERPDETPLFNDRHAAGHHGQAPLPAEPPSDTRHSRADTASTGRGTGGGPAATGMSYPGDATKAAVRGVRLRRSEPPRCRRSGGRFRGRGVCPRDRAKTALLALTFTLTGGYSPVWWQAGSNRRRRGDVKAASRARVRAARRAYAPSGVTPVTARTPR